MAKGTAKSSSSNDLWCKLIGKLDEPFVLVPAVCCGMAVLVYCRLVLFALGLPVLAYVHYSREHEKDADEVAGGDPDEDDDYGGLDADEDFSFEQPRKQQGGRPQRNHGAGRADDFCDDLDALFNEESLGSKPRNGLQSSSLVDDLDGDDPLGFLGRDDDILAGLGGGFGGGFGGGGDNKGKGRGKGKSKDKDKDRDKGKGDGKGKTREADPCQVFVAGVSGIEEAEIQDFFSQSGEVVRLKVLTNEMGESKGVCFVTFQTADQAKDALGLHGTELNGSRLTVRPANSGKGASKGDAKANSSPSFDFGGGGGLRGDLGSDLGGGLRGDLGGGHRGDFGSSSRGNLPGGRNRREEPEPQAPSEPRTEMDELLEEALAEEDGPLRPSDFDFGSKRFLTELMNRDRAEGTSRAVDALDAIFRQTRSKDRESVRKWPAYIYQLLEKLEPELVEELNEQKMEQRLRKREVRKAGDAPLKEEVDRAWKYAPAPAQPSETREKKEGKDSRAGTAVLDRWGKPVYIYD